MSDSQKKTKDSFAIMDYFPAASVALLGKTMSYGFNGSPEEMGTVTGLSAGIGVYLGLKLSRYIRLKLTTPMQRQLAFKVWSIVIPISVSMFFLTILAVMFGDQLAGQGTKTSIVLDDHAKKMLADAKDTSIKVQTNIQSAEGATNKDITDEVATTWASYFNDQATKAGKQACLKYGGTETSCNQNRFEETHQLIKSQDNNVVLINLTSYQGNTIQARAIRVMTIKGSELMSVGCLRNVDMPVTPTMSPCAEEIKKSFGFSFPNK